MVVSPKQSRIKWKKKCKEAKRYYEDWLVKTDSLK